jgi:hypothetical protein
VIIPVANKVKSQSDELQREAIREGLEDVDACLTVTMDAMDRWSDSLDTLRELPHPKQ